MDILAAIASDPTALPLWGVVLFAAGMYPIGMIFGCSACCGEVCRSCCRDDVSQVVIDFSLEGTGEQLIKETPWYGNFAFDFESAPIRVDPLDELPIKANNWANRTPMFIAEGQESGAKWLFPAVNNQNGTVRPLFTSGYASPMGNTDRTEFINGEAVTITPRPTVPVIQEPSLTAVVPECPDARFKIGNLNASFAGTPGAWEWQQDDFPVNLYVDCQSDEGTVIFDVESHDGQKPGECDDCTPRVSRFMSHPASFLLNPCTSYVGQRFSVTREYSALSVSVNLMSQSPETCGSTITAKATRSWQHLGAWCVHETTYTLAANEQDCYPFSAWPSKTTIEGPGNYEEQLVTLSATSCFGSGFVGIATEPAGVPGVDNGPLTAVEIVESGSGYAIKGRVEPSPENIKITGGGGAGAELTVAWSESGDECGRPAWTVGGVSVAAGGDGYAEQAAMSIAVSSPAFEAVPAALRAVTGREEPEVVLAYASGSGAELEIKFTKAGGSPSVWSIDTITVVDGGSGYGYGEFAIFEVATDVDFVNNYAAGEIQTSVSEPSIELNGGTGDGAAITVTLASNGGSPETWGVSSAEITAGGEGYQADDQLLVGLGEGDVEVAAAFVTVSSVDESGAITGVTIGTPGQYYHDDGVIVGISLYDSGEYYRSNGVLESVEVDDGGSYYEESDTAPAIVAGVEIEIMQKSPSDGSGAAVLATVDDDPASETFGQIVDLSISGGPEYSEPTLSLSIPGGTGGALEIDGYFLRGSGGAAGYYGISGVTVSSGGSGYTDNAQATVVLGEGDEKFPSSSSANVRIRTTLRAPSNEWILEQASGSGSGSGLVVSLTTARIDDEWYGTAASVGSGGTGYVAGDEFFVTATEGDTLDPASVIVTAVGSVGEATALSLAYPGRFVVDMGVISGVELGWQGAYRKVGQAQDGGDGYLAVHYEPGVCTGEGGVYRSCYGACTGHVCEDITSRGLLFRRGCPDYTCDITIQQGGD